MKQTDFKQKLENYFNPAILKQNLLIASLFIAVFDNFKSSIITRVKDFYWSGMKNGVDEYRDYETEVLSKIKSNKNKQIKASLFWLKESNVITTDDENKFLELTTMRNKLAHEMSKMLLDGFPENIYELYSDMIILFNKIEKWWIIEVEIPINPPNIPLKDICWDEITSLNIEFIKIMSDIAFTENDKYMQLVREYNEED